MTDKKSTIITHSANKADDSAPVDAKVKEPIKKPSDKKPSTAKMPTKKAVSANKSTLSKTAILSLLLAVIAIAGVVASYLYIQQQQSELITALKKENSDRLKEYQHIFQKKLKTQQSQFHLSIKQTADDLNKSIEASRKKELTTLSESVSHLQQSIQKRQPSDWLIHEAEYLIRLASRSLWMEKDTTATINLLKDADTRLVELNDPYLLSIRQLIHEDIKALEAMPQLATDYIVLTLMALNKEVPNLPLTFDNLVKNQDIDEDLKLSENIDDWETNLSKSWKKFFNDFIRIRHRTGSIEPLMSPNQQLNLKNNLTLKIQLAIWAASQRKSEVYTQSLNNVELWLNDYFDMNATVNKKFINDIIQLKQKLVNYNYPADLSSLTAIRKLLEKRKVQKISPNKATETEKAVTKEPKNNTDTNVKAGKL